MTCFGISFKHARISRWFRSLYTSACCSDDLTDWNHDPNVDHRHPHPSNTNALAFNSPRSERNDAKVCLDTESSPCGDRPNSSSWTDRRMSQIPTPPNSPPTSNSDYFAYAPSGPRIPAPLEMRKDQPLPTTSSCTPSPERTGDTSANPSNKRGPWILPIIDEALLVLDTPQPCKYEGVLFGNSIESSLILRIEGRGRFCCPLSYFNRQDTALLRWKLGFLLSQDEWDDIRKHGFVWH
ncbi:hypothetical protein ASPBRDRAFT_49533 [Aspergillus brasiliensis CBS 101740]|uniref:Uncharacterized protein n=1 Tax=Aspergillus brasiliensis (strain CBS 101740 / IMI 381727 / IBT 21946) TaxID=767769 RepID=A0A1L9U1Z8_ASPBC|nr:hypothetical protein ASPBRDRAFT_49533 [Aspergillus brasiliensis CBS 101740]